MADYTIKILTDSAAAEQSLDRVDKKKKELSEPVTVRVNPINTNTLTQSLSVVKASLTTALTVSQFLPGFMDIADALKRGARGATTLAAAMASIPKDPGGIISSSFDTAAKSAERLTGTIAQIGFAMFGVTQSVNVLKAAYGTLFDETIGREIRLQETLLRTKTAIVANSKVLVNEKNITDPYKAIIALDKPIEKTLQNIRTRSLQIAGTTSDAIVQTFGVVAQQIGQFNGSLKDAEDLAISFAGALGTLGMADPTLAVQEVRSILTGNIGPDSLLARTLGITGPDIAKAKASTEGLVGWLTKKLAAFSAGQAIASRSFFGISSNIAEIRQELLRALGKPILDPILTGLNSIYERMSAIVKPAMVLADTMGKTAAAVAGGIGRAVVASPIVKKTEGSGAQQLMAGAQAQADRFLAYVKGQISEMQPVITKFVTQFGAALAQFGQGLAKLIEGFAQFKFENFKVWLNALSNMGAILNATLVPAVKKILELYGQLLELPPVQYMAQYLAQWTALEKLQVLPMARGIFTIAKSWSSVSAAIKFVKEGVGAVGNAFNSFRDMAVSALQTVADTIRKALVALVDLGVAGATFGAKLAAGIVGGIGTLAAKLLAAVGGISTQLITAAEETLTSILSRVSLFIQQLIIKIGGGLGGVTGVLSAMLEGLSTKLGGMEGMQPVIDTIEKMREGLANVPEGAEKMAKGVQGATDKANQGVANLATGARGAGEKIKDLGVKGEKGIKGLQAPIMGAIGNIKQFGIQAGESLMKFDFGLGLIKRGLSAVGAGIAQFASFVGTALGSLVKSVAIFYAQMLLLQLAITLVTDLAGRFTKSMEDTRSAENAAKALNDLDTKYKNVGESSTRAAQQAKAAAEQIVTARYDQLSEELATLSARLNEMKWEDSREGVDSLGEAFRGVWGLARLATDSFNKFIDSTRDLTKVADPLKGLIDSLDKLIARFTGIKNLIASIKLPEDTLLQMLPFGAMLKNLKDVGARYAGQAAQGDVDKVKREQGALERKEKEKADADAFRLMSNQQLDLSKQLRELAMQRENALHQLRMSLMGKEIDIYQASQQVLMKQASMRANEIMKGEQGAARTMMENITRYLTTKKEGEISIEVSKRKMVIEVLNMEREMTNLKYETQKQIAELQKVMGAYETGVADYKYQMALKQAEALQSGVAEGGMGMTGDTGLKIGSTGRSSGVHAHVQKKGGGGGITEAEARAIFADSSNLVTTDVPGSDRGDHKHGGYDLATKGGKEAPLVLADGYKLVDFIRDNGAAGNTAVIMNETTKKLYEIMHLAKAPAGWTMAAQGAGTGASGPQTGIQGYAKRLAYLETNMKWDINKSSGTKGFFQFKDGTAQEAEDKFGVPKAQLTSKNYGTAATAFSRYIAARFPKAYEAIQRGDFNTADKMLKGVWTSLPGGAEARDKGTQATAMKLAGRTVMTGGGDAPAAKSSGMPTPPKMPNIKALGEKYLADTRKFNEQLIEADKRLADIAAQISKLQTKEAFNSIVDGLFSLPDLQAANQELEDAKILGKQLADEADAAFNPQKSQAKYQYEKLLNATYNERKEALRGIAVLKASQQGLSPEDEAKAVEKINKKYGEKLTRLRDIYEVQKLTAAENAKNSMVDVIRGSTRDAVEGIDNDRRGILRRMQTMRYNSQQMEDPMTARMLAADDSIEEFRRKLKKSNPDSTDAMINESADFKKFVEATRNGAKELGGLERSAKELQKKLDEIQVIKEAFSGGLRNVIMTALKGGDVGAAAGEAAGSIGEKFLGMATDYITKPFEQMLEQNLRKWMGVDAIKTPQEQNTNALETAKISTDANTAALQELTVALNNIVTGPSVFQPSGTKSGGDPFGGITPTNAPDFSSVFSPSKLNNSTNLFDTSALSNVSSLFNTSIDNFSAGVTAAATGTNFFTDALGDTPAAAGKAASSVGSFFSDALSNILGSVLKGGGGGKGVGGLFSGIIGGLFGGGGGGGGDLFSGILGFAGGGNPPMGRASLVGEKGPELSIARGLQTIIPSSTTQSLMANLSNPMDRSQAELPMFDPKIQYDGQTLVFDSTEYVRKDDIPRMMGQFAKQSHGYSMSRLRDSPAQRRSAGI